LFHRKSKYKYGGTYESWVLPCFFKLTIKLLYVVQQLYDIIHSQSVVIGGCCNSR